MVSTFIVSHESPTRVRRSVRSLGKEGFDYQEMSYQLLRGDMPFDHRYNGEVRQVLLKAYWIRITGKTFRNGVMVREEGATEGPVTTDLQKARQFCDYLSEQWVFPEHLISILEDQVFSLAGGLDYAKDFEKAAQLILGLPKVKRKKDFAPIEMVMERP